MRFANGVRWGAGLLAALVLVQLAISLGPSLIQPRFEQRLTRGALATVSARSIRVYVSGAVAQPGVVNLREGDRIEQALAAAGGPLIDAELTGINLALKVVDEQQIHVAAKGEPSESPVPASELINLNTADRAQLESLPGIGQVRAGNILEYREKVGRFGSLEELVAQRLIPAAIFDQIRGLISLD